MFNREILQKHLNDKGISAMKFADRIGCSQQFLSYVLRGLKQPSVALLGRICEETGLSADELIVKK